MVYFVAIPPRKDLGSGTLPLKSALLKKGKINEASKTPIKNLKSKLGCSC